MSKNKKIIIGIIVIVFIIISVIVVYKVIEKSVTNREDFKFKIQNVNTNPVDTTNIVKDNDKNEGDNTMETITTIKVSINDKIYNAKIENNETAQSFISRLPQEFEMKELNGNEKYVYMEKSLPTNSSNPKHIESGDIMLYGNDCLVIFYKSFNTNYSYTKIGHIDNLPDLKSGSITAKFEK